jgi:hypothetical protein
MIIIFVECSVECKNVTIIFISQFLFPPCLYATELAAKVHLSCTLDRLEVSTCLNESRKDVNYAVYATCWRAIPLCMNRHAH